MSELNLILLGPPGSGKGTQGEALQEDLRLPYYATGDILRAAVKDGTQIGKQAKEYMDRGELVPDEVTIGVIGERVEGPDASDGFIPGVRPGRPTAEYLDRILSRLTFPGALYLGAVAALPTILISQTSANFFFGGTSILIVVGVALDTVKQLEAQLMMRNYEGFLK